MVSKNGRNSSIYAEFPRHRLEDHQRGSESTLSSISGKVRLHNRYSPILGIQWVYSYLLGTGYGCFNFYRKVFLRSIPCGSAATGI